MTQSVGIVGSEAAKFTPATEAKARELIRSLIANANTVISGACHLGGIDIWAAEEARTAGLTVIEYAPANRQWSTGYKPRNLKIAQASDEVHCITLAGLPEGYTGMRFDLCYHCGSKSHIKSGGCWTAKQARLLGKPGIIHVIT